MSSKILGKETQDETLKVSRNDPVLAWDKIFYPCHRKQSNNIPCKLQICIKVTIEATLDANTAIIISSLTMLFSIFLFLMVKPTTITIHLHMLCCSIYLASLEMQGFFWLTALLRHLKKHDKGFKLESEGLNLTALGKKMSSLIQLQLHNILKR